jgi:hypothetical protein
MTKKKKKEEKPPKVKNLGDVHKETLEAISKGINQVGIEWQKDEPWEDLAKKCKAKNPKLAQQLEDAAKQFIAHEHHQCFHVGEDL